MRDSLNAKITVPFAGKYILGGKLHYMNSYRGISDAVEICEFDPNAIVLADGGYATIDTLNLKPSATRQLAYDSKLVEEYAKSTENFPMSYDVYFKTFPEDAIPIIRLLLKGYKNAVKKSICTNDHFFCIKFDQQWCVMNANKNNPSIEFTDKVDLITPRSEIYISKKYLFGLLTLVFNWNNAEIGSQYLTRRYPDEFDRHAQLFLNFLHV